MVKCVKCGWIYCGQFYDEVLTVISGHNRKAKHKQPDFEIGVIPTSKYREYLENRHNPKWWYLYNNRNKPENLKKVSTLFIE